MGEGEKLDEQHQAMLPSHMSKDKHLSEVDLSKLVRESIKKEEQQKKNQCNTTTIMIIVVVIGALIGVVSTTTRRLQASEYQAADYGDYGYESAMAFRLYHETT